MERRPNAARAVRCVAIGALAVLMLLPAVAGGKRTKHPVAVKRTVLVGNRVLRAEHDHEPANRSQAFPAGGDATGTARSLDLYVDSGNGARIVEVAIYSNAGGHPGLRLSTGSKSRPTAGSWNQIGVAPVKIHRGRHYWLAVLGLGGTVAFRDTNDGPCLSIESAQANLKALPRHWSAGPRWRTCPLSAFVSSGKASRTTTPVPTPTPTPTTTPAPTPPPSNGRKCASDPSACGYPDPSNTGVPSGTALHASGDIEVTTPGAVVSNLDVNGTITVGANNVTIKDTRVTNNDPNYDGIDVQSGVTGTVIEDTTVQGGDTSTPVGSGIVGNQITINRVDVHFAVEDVNGGANTVENSYLISDGNISGGHNEAILVADGTSLPENIEHNTLLNPLGQTAAIIAGGPWGALENVTINNNIMAGGDFVTECCQWSGQPNPTNTKITNNRYSRIYFPDGGSYGAVDDLDTRYTTFTGNIWDDTLQPVMAPSP